MLPYFSVQPSSAHVLSGVAAPAVAVVILVVMVVVVVKVVVVVVGHRPSPGWQSG